MKILIDAHMVGSGEGGNERYMASLIDALHKLTTVDVIVERDIKINGSRKKHLIPKSNLMRYLFFIPKLVLLHKYDLVLSTYFVSPFVASKNIIIVHDLLPYRHPEYFSVIERIQFKFLKYSIKHACAVLVPTTFIRNEIKHFFPDSFEKTFVVNEAANAIFQSKKNKERAILRRKYKADKYSVLVMGSKYQKRPVEPVLKGLLPLARKINIFVLSGKEDIREKYRSKLNIFWLKKLSDQELNDYYNLVDVVVYPTIYEGFGLPVLEAMQCGTPVVTNKIPPIFEIVGSAVQYFSLKRPSTLTKQIRLLMNKPEVKKQIITRGYNVAKSYSWSKAAGQVTQIFRGVSK